MSTIYAISDVHVKGNQDNSEILKEFLSLSFKEGDVIYFLGDIFDLLVGPHAEYKQVYPWFFEFIEECKEQGVEVNYVEGNHDFHIENLFKDSSINILKGPQIKVWNDKKILLCHGDEIELGNSTYKIYKKFITSKPLNIVANYIMPYPVLRHIGERASQNSRNRNKNRYGNSQQNIEIRDRFRMTAIEAMNKFNVDIVLCGHSHFWDEFHFEGKSYYNCGFVPTSQKYIKITDIVELKDLKD